MEDGQQKPWITSNYASGLFLIAAWVTAISFIAVATLTAMDVAQALHVENWHMGIHTFWIVFCLLATSIVLQLYLWLGMMWFLIRHDKNSSLAKGLWMVLVLCGISYGAAIYHFVSYRRVLKRVCAVAGGPG